MKQVIIVMFALLALSAAMVPRDRRAINTEEEEEQLRDETVDSTTEKICAPVTPCAWSIYKPPAKIIQVNITNSYCTCSPGTTCQQIDDDTVVNAYVFRCRPIAFQSDSENSFQPNLDNSFQPNLDNSFQPNLES